PFSSIHVAVIMKSADKEWCVVVGTKSEIHAFQVVEMNGSIWPCLSLNAVQTTWIRPVRRIVSHWPAQVSIAAAECAWILLHPSHANKHSTVEAFVCPRSQVLRHSIVQQPTGVGCACLGKHIAECA